jgi:hypothetical protein
MKLMASKPKAAIGKKIAVGDSGVCARGSGMDVFVPPVAGTVVPLEPLGLEGPSDPKGSLLGAVVVAVPSSSIPVEEEAGDDCPSAPAVLGGTYLASW